MIDDDEMIGAKCPHAIRLNPRSSQGSREARNHALVDVHKLNEVVFIE
jgi:hypothetical protein